MVCVLKGSVIRSRKESVKKTNFSGLSIKALSLSGDVGVSGCNTDKEKEQLDDTWTLIELGKDFTTPLASFWQIASCLVFVTTFYGQLIAR